jgi:hypothetical protein
VAGSQGHVQGIRQNEEDVHEGVPDRTAATRLATLRNTTSPGPAHTWIARFKPSPQGAGMDWPLPSITIVQSPPQIPQRPQAVALISMK